METLKNTATKFFAIIAIAGLFAGCSSVADAGLSEIPQEATVKIDAPTPDPIMGGDDPNAILDEPTMDGF